MAMVKFVLRKDEGLISHDIKSGDAVEDADGYNGVVIAVGCAGDLFKKFRASLRDIDVEELAEYMNDDINWATVSGCAVVRYYSAFDKWGGDCALWLDPINELYLI